MLSRLRLVYHLGWLVGVLMVGFGVLSIGWTLGGPADGPEWNFLTWLALLQAVAGVGWLLSWYYVDRHRGGGASSRVTKTPL